MTNFKRVLSSLTIAALSATSLMAQSPGDFVPYVQTDLRLPSVPLLTNDPYFSIWSHYDALNEGPTRHWCEHEKAIDGILRVDGTAYRFMGQGNEKLLKPIAGMTVDGVDWTGKVSYSKQSDTAWAATNFNDSSWKTETAAWGTAGEYPNVKNSWTATNSDIYVRRTVSLSTADLEKDLWIVFSHDDVFELYINGTRVILTGETWKQGEEHKLTAAQKALLKAGNNIIAAHCHNTTGGAYVDFGLYENTVKQEAEVQLAQQISVDVLATSSYYKFSCGPVILDLVFTAPMLIDDLDLISTPINYISYQVTSADGNKHDVQFYLATSAQFTVNEMSQPTISTTTKQDGINYIKAGSEAQNILGRSGDLITIDWGYLYIPAINGEVSVAATETAESSFVASGNLPECLSGEIRSTNRSNMPTLCFVKQHGKVKEARNFMLIGYDEIYDMQYMKQNYKAYYARNGKTIFQAFKELRDNYSSIMTRCRALDKTIYDDALAAGNVKYAEMLSGCYRLVMAAHKLFQDNTGKALYFSKENKSNGCVNTVDLTYPECPLYLLYNPELQKGMILSILDYALSDERKGKNCAAHDLGQYPLANGQVYGDTMPLEESANILILADAICRITGDGEWLKPYRNVLKTWADYCRAEGQNPGNQLCTDDFRIMRELYGQVPGGMYGADENARQGYSDPRQGAETCAIVEQMASDEILMGITGDPFWADHCEEVALNTYTAALMPDMKSLRYITSPNMAISDEKLHGPSIDNNLRGMLSMSPFSSRCCQHNHGMGWPYYAEHLVMATTDNGLAAMLYAASETSAKVANGIEVVLKENTEYPFEEKVTFTLHTRQQVTFPLYLRIPAWAKGASVTINGIKSKCTAAEGKYIRIDRTWSDGDKVVLNLPMNFSTRVWEQNKESVSVNYGPLTLSLKIAEIIESHDSRNKSFVQDDSHWQEGVDASLWPCYVLKPGSEWNYALKVDKKSMPIGIKVTKKAYPDNDMPFTAESVPFEFSAYGVQIPSWGYDATGMTDTLPTESATKAATETPIKLIPMGAARLRITAFPQYRK